MFPSCHKQVLFRCLIITDTCIMQPLLETAPFVIFGQNYVPGSRTFNYLREEHDTLHGRFGHQAYHPAKPFLSPFCHCCNSVQSLGSPPPVLVQPTADSTILPVSLLVNFAPLGIYQPEELTWRHCMLHSYLSYLLSIRGTLKNYNSKIISPSTDIYDIIESRTAICCETTLMQTP